MSQGAPAPRGANDPVAAAIRRGIGQHAKVLVARPDDDHPDDELLARHVAGELPPHEALGVTTHLSSCASGACVALVRELAAELEAARRAVFGLPTWEEVEREGEAERPAEPGEPGRGALDPLFSGTLRPRNFQCREILWEQFTHIAEEGGRPMDELIVEAMTTYVAARRAAVDVAAESALEREPERAPAPPSGDDTAPDAPPALREREERDRPLPAAGRPAGPPSASPPSMRPPPMKPAASGPSIPPPARVAPGGRALPPLPPTPGASAPPAPPSRRPPPPLPSAPSARGSIPPPLPRAGGAPPAPPFTPPASAPFAPPGAAPLPPGFGAPPRAAAPVTPPPLAAAPLAPPPLGAPAPAAQRPLGAPALPGGFGAPATSPSFPAPGAAPTRKLVAVYQGQTYPVEKARFTIGRSKANDLPIRDGNVSREHAIVEIAGGDHYIVDNASTNGIEFRDQRITRKAIQDGDVFVIGGHVIEFRFQP